MQTLPGKRGVYRFPVPSRPAPNNRQILLRDALFLHQQSKPARGSWRLRDEHESAGFAIEPIYYGNLSAVGDFKSQQTGQLAPKRSRTVRFRGMHQQQRRFLHYDVIFPFGNYAESGRDSCVSFRTGG